MNFCTKFLPKRAKNTVNNPIIRIEESKPMAKSEEWGDSLCAKVIRELETIKRELSKLKLDMALVLEEKRRAEKETEFFLSKTESYSRSLATLKKEIEEVNEEHVMVELARVEAVNEYEEIESQRREKAEKFLGLMEEAQIKKQSITQEIEISKEMETKLSITTSDANMLQSELNQLKEMDKGLETNDVITELEAAKKELNLVKEESFQFMASMDVVRKEIMHIAEEKAKLKKKDEKTEIFIQNLTSKLLRAKAKLEATSVGEDKARSMFSNLTATLEQLESEAETAKNERSMISHETAAIKAEVQQTETEIDIAEEKLKSAVEELKAVKSSEALALENLKVVIESTMRNRASSSRASSKIAISKFEYEYLTGHAFMAKEIADKKVAAAQAWIEAVKASEKEILVKTEILRRETREMRVEEKTEEMVPEKHKGPHSKGVKMTPTRRAKARKSVSPIVHATHGSKSFTIRRRKNR